MQPLQSCVLLDAQIIGFFEPTEEIPATSEKEPSRYNLMETDIYFPGTSRSVKKYFNISRVSNALMGKLLDNWGGRVYLNLQVKIHPEKIFTVGFMNYQVIGVAHEDPENVCITVDNNGNAI